MNKRWSKWTVKDQKYALSQGWGIFNIDNKGYLEIQKNDELNSFKSDEEAVKFVIERLETISYREEEEGSTYEKAIYIILNQHFRGKV